MSFWAIPKSEKEISEKWAIENNLGTILFDFLREKFLFFFIPKIDLLRNQTFCRKIVDDTTRILKNMKQIIFF